MEEKILELELEKNKINLIRIPYTDENNIDKILDLKLKGN